MSLIIAHTQKNQTENTLASRATCSTFCTRMESTENDYEKLLTHTPTHRVASKGWIVWQVFKKNNMEKTNLSTHLPFFFFHTEICCDFDEFVIVFVFYEPAESRGGGRGTTRCRRLPVTKSSLRGVDQPSVEVCWWSRVRLAPPQPSPPGSILTAGEIWTAAVADRQKSSPPWLVCSQIQSLPTVLFSLCCDLNTERRRWQSRLSRRKLIINSQTESRTIINHNFILFIAEI